MAQWAKAFVTKLGNLILVPRTLIVKVKNLHSHTHAHKSINQSINVFYMIYMILPLKAHFMLIL